MKLSKKNKPQTVGIVLLFAGVALLAFTFMNAFLFLQEPISILTSGNLASVFGDSLGYLIQASIRLMYLGIMGWIGSLLTVRGIPLVTHRAVPIISGSRLQPNRAKQAQSKPVLQQSQVASHSGLGTKVESHAIEEQPSPHLTQAEDEPKAILIPPENQREV